MTARETSWDGLLLGASLATLDVERGYGEIENGAIGWKDGVLTFVGPRSALADAPDALAEDVVEVDGGWVTPGLIDCHTHLVFAGDRAHEFELRLEGASYEEIARAGGGILSTVRAVREADEDALLAQSLPRARALLRDGATTLEIKSGYGLNLENERKMLRVARRLGDTLGVTLRMHCRLNSRAARTITSTRSSNGCRNCMPRVWSMPWMRSAKASASRPRRRGGYSRLRRR